MDEPQSGLVRTAREVSAAELRAWQRQCARCALRDRVPALASGLVAGLVTAVATGGAVPDLVGPPVLVLLLAALTFRLVWTSWARAMPPGTVVETVLGPDVLASGPVSVSLPQVTGVRTEGGLVRVDTGRDHCHVLLGHVDLDEVRRRAGHRRPDPPPALGAIVEVPPGLARQAASRVVLWHATRSPALLVTWLLVLVLAGLRDWPLAATVGTVQLVLLLIDHGAERREFDRLFPPSVPTASSWRGDTLELQSSLGITALDLTGTAAARFRGGLVVVDRPGGSPLMMPAVVVPRPLREHLGLGN